MTVSPWVFFWLLVAWLSYETWRIARGLHR